MSAGESWLPARRNLPDLRDVLARASTASATKSALSRFGEDPTMSAFDLNCKAHNLDNLYVVDGSFMVSRAAVNSTLTIIANALRVEDHLLEKLGSTEVAAGAEISKRSAYAVRNW